MAFLDLWRRTEAVEGRTLKGALSDDCGLAETPKWNAARCGRGKREKDPCTLCADVCPQGCYPGDARKMPDWSACIGCGLCAAVCPDHCLTLPLKQAKAFLEREAKKGPLVLSCSEDGDDAPESRCMAAAGWEQMAYAALGEGLVLDMSACTHCAHAVLRQKLEERIGQLRFFLGDALFEQRVTLSAQPVPEPEEEGFTRREMFRAVLEFPQERLQESLPRPETAQDSGLLMRAMLRRRISRQAGEAAPQERPRFRAVLPQFTDACYNCGTCAWKCPQKALKLVNEQGHILVTIEVWRCSGCGICQTHCKTGAITGIAPMRVPGFGKIALKRIPAYLCEDCGKPRPKDAKEGVCAACLGQRKMRRIRAQREQERSAAAKRQELEE